MWREWLILARYQYGNHLGSMSMALDETAQLMSILVLQAYGCPSATPVF